MASQLDALNHSPHMHDSMFEAMITLALALSLAHGCAQVSHWRHRAMDAEGKLSSCREQLRLVEVARATADEVPCHSCVADGMPSPDHALSSCVCVIGLLRP